MSDHPVSVDEAVVQQQANATYGSRNTPERLAWLQDAGFGLFIHWSVDVQLGCVISHSLVGASEDYVSRYFGELPQTFCPDRWDADRVARLARIAGAQYAVFTTKHHNGFCMWDTKTTDFSIMRTPYAQDIVRQYVDAFRRQGISVGFYFSPEDFHFLHRHGQIITRNPVEMYPEEVMTAYHRYLREQMTELMTLFGPIDLIFFDGGELMQDAQGESLQTMCKNLAWDLQPGILVTRGAISTPEQTLPGVGAREPWEACITLASAWGYQPTNEIYKTGEHVIRMLAGTRAMGGSLLLNIGPDANGDISAMQEGLLREIGLWNFINREAVVGVRPWHIAREGDLILLADKTGETLYAVATGQGEWARGERRDFVIKSAIATRHSQASVLGASGALTEYRPDLDAESHLAQEPDGLRISVLNAQRVYCGVQWPNPLVIRVTHVQKAFEPMHIETLEGRLEQTGEGAALHAQVKSLGSFSAAEVSFRWRVYPGFSMAAYEDGWRASASVAVTQPCEARVLLPDLRDGVTYQYHAVIANGVSEAQGERALFVRKAVEAKP